MSHLTRDNEGEQLLLQVSSVSPDNPVDKIIDMKAIKITKG